MIRPTHPTPRGEDRPPPNRLRELREARGWTLAELAARVGTSNQQISNLELGKRQLTVDWLRRLGTALNCHPWAVVEALETSTDGSSRGD